MLNSRTSLLVLLIALLSFQQILSNAPEPSSILYDFTGKCEGNFLCLPYSNISFSSIWNQRNQTQLIQQLNQELQIQPNLNHKLFFKESRFQEGEIGLFAKEHIKKSELLGSFSTSHAISSLIDLSSFEKTSYYQEHKEYPQLEFDHFADNSLRLTLNLLYHIYHLEDSNLQQQILSFPSKPDTPLFTFSIYEAKLIRPDRAFDFFYTIRSKCLDDYERLVKKMKDAWSQEQIKSFLNGMEKIPLDDYVYAYYIYLTRTITVKQDEGKYFNFMTPFLNHAKRFREDYENPKPDKVIVNEDEKSINVYSNGNYEEDDEIYFDVYEAGSHYQLIIHGIVPKNNPFDCFTIEFLSEDQGKALGLQTTECVSAGNQELLKYFITCNLVNMKKKYAPACQQHLLEVKYDTIKMTEIMMEKCKLHKWTMWNFFEEPENDLSETIEKYNEFVVRVKEYMYMRYKEEKSRKNSNLIYQYYMERMKVAKDTIFKMENLYESVIAKVKKKKKVEKKERKSQINEKLEKGEEIQENFEEQIVKEFDKKGDFKYQELEDSEQLITKKNEEKIKVEL